MPDMEGWIGAEAHYIESGPYMMVSSDLKVDEFKYEGTPLGNWEFSGVYLPGDEKDHHVDGYIRHNNKEIAHLGGIYLPTTDGKGNLSADVAFEHFPLNVINPFIPDNMIELGGDIDGTLPSLCSMANCHSIPYQYSCPNYLRSSASITNRCRWSTVK